MGFRTKLDYSDNRQIKQREQTFTSLSGASTFGLPFSALTTGADLDTIVELESGAYSGGTTFSGNNMVTLFNWVDDRFSVADGTDAFSVLTPSNSATTQNSGYLFAPNETTVIDGNPVTLSYSGMNFDITVETMTDFGGTYVGTISHDKYDFVSASTLDFTGRTIWVDSTEITRTDRLIVSRGASSGYILVSDDEGMATWSIPPSGFSATTLWEVSSGSNSIKSKTPGTLSSGDFSLTFGTGTTASGLISHAQGKDTTASGNYSHAEGAQTTASGNFSHAEGRLTIASGQFSHAEGFVTTATQIGSHAEGNNTLASGQYSHVEGQSSTASGDISHAGGLANEAFSYGERAIGLFGTEYIPNSVLTWAYDDRLFNIGNGTTTVNRSDAFQVLKSGEVIAPSLSIDVINSGDSKVLITKEYGDANYSGGSSSPTYWVSGSTGDGITAITNTTVYVPNLNITSTQTSINNFPVLTIDGNGNVFKQTFPSGGSGITPTIYWVSGSSGTNSIITVGNQSGGGDATGSDSVAMGRNTIASGDFGSHAQGLNTTASGQSSHAEGNGTIASGGNSHAEGTNTQAIGGSSYAGGTNTIAQGGTSHASGVRNTAHSYAETSIGLDGTNYIPASPSSWVATDRVFNIGNGQSDLLRSDAFQVLKNGTVLAPSLTTGLISAASNKVLITKEYGDANYAGGGGSGVWVAGSAGTDSIRANNATGLDATGDYAVAQGRDTTASGNASHSEGQGTTASGSTSHAEGSQTVASGFGSHAEGSQTVASGTASHAEGRLSEASGFYSHAEGHNTIASGDYSHAEGWLNTASGRASHAEGWNTTASGRYSHAGGRHNIAHSYSETAIGIYGTDYVPNSTTSFNSADRVFNIGNGISDGSRSDALTILKSGEITAPSLTTAIIGSASNKVLITKEYADINYASGGGSGLWVAGSTGTDSLTTIVNKNSGGDATNTNAIAMGKNTTASGFAAHATGENSTASGSVSHVEGANNIASGSRSHAEGDNTIASGDSSHAQGSFTTASGNHSHAEGRGTTASGGDASHAEGFETTASGSTSHSEGWRTIAGGTQSHAEGRYTFASGGYSHAEGDYTTSSGYSSHAQGSGTLASGGASHAEGVNTTASGSHSHAEGQQTIASGTNSHAGGRDNTAHSYAETAIGMYGTDYVPNSTTGYNINDRVFNIGNGISDGSRSDALTIFKNGNAILTGDLTISGLVSVTDLQTDVNGKLVDGASDITLKSNINELETPLSKINKLRGVSFDWKPESNMGSGINFGLIAQEVQKVIPELVKPRVKHNEHLTLDYKALIPWLIEAIKELSTPSSPIFKETLIHTETITSEDSDILLNFNGNHASALDGGLVIRKGVNEETNSQFIINSEGNWVSNTYLIPHGIVIPIYTPTSSSDNAGKVGEITRDENHLYIKGDDNQWKRTKLETF